MLTTPARPPARPQVKRATDPIYVFADPQYAVPAAGGAAPVTVAVVLPIVAGWPPAGSPYTAAQFSMGTQHVISVRAMTHTHSFHLTPSASK